MPNTFKKIIPTIKDQVYNIIKENILSERYKPGERINEVTLAKEMGVSRSPVRSAINELVGEGLLEAKPHQYVRVRKLTEKEITDVYEFRLIVEQFAIQKIVEMMNEQVKERLLQFKSDFTQCGTYDQLLEYVEIDSAFHNYLIEKSKNALVAETFSRISMLITPFRVIALKSQQRFEESIEEHIGMIQSMCNVDIEEAKKYCRDHLSRAKAEIVSYMKQIQLELEQDQ